MSMMAEKNADSRFVSRLARNTLALVLAGGKGSRLQELTEWRAKPAVPFGGKFRIIDFPLSNCVNSGIRRLGVLTQYKAHSLIRHLVQGWSNFSVDRGEFLEILPASQRTGGEWYRGTADAVYQNLDIIRTHAPEFVLVLAGDHIYKMDYGPLLAAHVEQQADMSVCCIEVPRSEAAGAYGVMTVDDAGRIIGFEEKPRDPHPIPGRPDFCLASMGNYVFNTMFLYEQVIRDADTSASSHDFGKDIIPHVIGKYRVMSFPFRAGDATGRAYWRDVGTVDAYYEANLELTRIDPELDLYDLEWPIATHQAQLPPAKFVHDVEGRRGMAIDSMVSGGCIVSGSAVFRSLLFSSCHVHSFSTITDSVLLNGVEIGERCRINRAIIDRGARIPPGSEIGIDHARDREQGFRVSPGGVVLVTPTMLGQQVNFAR
ncbi:MAG: glucose-1-phosphate adenylyltransferase [Steroidobacteraceae bacterium]